MIFGLAGRFALCAALASASALACEPANLRSQTPMLRPPTQALAEELIGAAAQAKASTIIVGDSIFYGWKSAASDLGADVFNFGVPGDRTENALYRLRAAKLPRFKRAIVLIGTNNLRRDGPCEVYAGVVAIAQELRKVADAVYVVSILPRGEGLQVHRDVIEQANALLRSNRSFTYIDAFQPYAQSCRGPGHCSLLRDVVHPSPPGYELLGKVIRQSLR